MNWNFFGSGHGKGEWDGASAVVKRTLRSEQLLNPQRTLQNVDDCVTFLEATLGGEVANSRDSLRYCTFTEDRSLFQSTYRESQIHFTMSVIVSLSLLDMLVPLTTFQDTAEALAH